MVPCLGGHRLIWPILAIQGNGKITHEHISLYIITIWYNNLIFIIYLLTNLYGVKSIFWYLFLGPAMIHSRSIRKSHLDRRERNFQFFVCLKRFLTRENAHIYGVSRFYFWVRFHSKSRKNTFIYMWKMYYTLFESNFSYNCITQ